MPVVFTLMSALVMTSALDWIPRLPLLEAVLLPSPMTPLNVPADAFLNVIEPLAATVPAVKSTVSVGLMVNSPVPVVNEPLLVIFIAAVLVEAAPRAMVLAPLTIQVDPLPLTVSVVDSPLVVPEPSTMLPEV